ncbi:hypothetical protein D3C79_721880 [compost metagenome]
MLGQEHLQAPAADVFMGHEVRQADDAFTGQGQLTQGFTAGGRQARTDQQAVALGMAQRPVVEGFGLGETEQYMPLQVFDPFRGAVAGQVLGAGQQVQRAATERAGMQAGVGQLADANGNVGALFDQVDDQIAGVELQLDLRVQRAELADPGHDGMQHEGQGGIDAQASGRRLVMHRQVLFKFVHLLQDRLGPFEEESPFFGQVHAPGSTVDQRSAKLGFQARQGPADRRRRLPALFGGGGNRATLNHRDKHL